MLRLTTDDRWVDITRVVVGGHRLKRIDVVGVAWLVWHLVGRLISIGWTVRRLVWAHRVHWVVGLLWLVRVTQVCSLRVATDYSTNLLARNTRPGSVLCIVYQIRGGVIKIAWIAIKPSVGGYAVTEHFKCLAQLISDLQLWLYRLHPNADRLQSVVWLVRVLVTTLLQLLLILKTLYTAVQLWSLEACCKLPAFFLFNKPRMIVKSNIDNLKTTNLDCVHSCCAINHESAESSWQNFESLPMTPNRTEECLSPTGQSLGGWFWKKRKFEKSDKMSKTREFVYNLCDSLD